MNIRSLSAIVLLLPLATIAGQEPRGGDPEVLLKAAMTRELVQGDLPGAVAEYRRIASGPSTSRGVAARALLQLAMAYEKQGHPDARPTYERIVRDYADQRQIAERARGRVAALAQTVTGRAPARRLLVDHRVEPYYGKPTRDGRSYLRYNDKARAFELFDFGTGRVRRLAAEGPSPDEASVAGISLQLSNNGRLIAGTVHAHKPGTKGETQDEIDRVELRIFEVGGRGPGRMVASWPMASLARFTARAFAWSPRDDAIWVKVMLRDGSAEIVSVDLKGARRTVKRIPWHDHSQPPSLSADGRFVTYHDSPDKGRPPDVMIVAADGSREQRLEHPATDNKPMFAPDGSGIVFESNRRGARDLWFVPVVDGRPTSEPRIVWRDVGAFGQVERFADNGALSYYFASNDYSVNTLPIDLDGGRSSIGERTLIPPVANEMNGGAAYSPDGRELLFFRSRGRRVALRETATGREREVPLGTELGPNAQASWCAAGDRVIVSGYAAGIGFLAFAVNPREATVQKIDLPDGDSPVCVNARDIVFLRLNGAARTFSVVRRAIEGGAETVLYTAPDMPCGCVRSIAASPDGTRLAFIIREPGRSRVVTLSAAGGPLSADLLTAGAPIDGQVSLLQNVAWMPDGQRLLVVRVEDEFAGAKGQTQRPLWLWEVPVDGGAARRIGLVPVSKVDGYFAGVFSLTVRADGKQIAYQSHEGYVEQTWAMENLLQTIRDGR